MSVLFVGGGTGGHIMPLLQVMEAFQAVSDEECHYVGSEKDMAFPAIRDSPFRFTRHVIRTGKLNRFVTWKHIPEGYRFVVGLADAVALVADIKPRAVFCKGSATSVAVAWAAARRGIPVYTHETDVAAGLSNRLASRYAKTVFTAFPVEHYDGLKNARYVGQPVRAVFRETDSLPLTIEGHEIPSDMPLVAVTGGSQGGRGLNNVVKAAWSVLLESARIVQVCGPHDIETLKTEREALPEHLRDRLVLVPFLGEEFPRLIKRTTLVVSRSGGTIFELAAAGKASVLVPLPSAAQDHQRKNAAVLASAHAAVIVQQDAADGFSSIVQDLLADQEKRQEVSENIVKFDRPGAAAEMATVLIEVK